MNRIFKWNLASAFVYLVATLFSPLVVSADTPSRGVLAVPDAFPLSQAAPQLRAYEAAVIPTNTKVSAALSWSNTENRKGDNFVIDAESVRLDLNLKQRLTDRLQLELELPTFWRGGGILDEPIFRWHELFFLPQGPRDDPDIGTNDFEIRGFNDDNESFSIDERGTELGDLTLSLKYVLYTRPENGVFVSLRSALQLPTATEETYGLKSIALSEDLLLAFRLGNFHIHSGAGFSYIRDTRIGEVQLEKQRYTAFFQLEYPFKPASAYLSFLYGGKLIRDIRRFPRYQFYFDTGIKIDIGDANRLVLAFRENPSPSEGTADFSVSAGWEFGF